MIEFMQVYADSNRFSITLSLKKDNQDIDTVAQLDLQRYAELLSQ